MFIYTTLASCKSFYLFSESYIGAVHIFHMYIIYLIYKYKYIYVDGILIRTETRDENF